MSGMETQRPSFVYDSLQALTDQIEQQPDPAVRLACYAYLLEHVQIRVLTARDAAAFEARQKYPVRDIAAVSGSDAKDVYYWSERHRARHGLPRLPRRFPQDISQARDITEVLGVAR
jgi:hypothetical protein